MSSQLESAFFSHGVPHSRVSTDTPCTDESIVSLASVGCCPRMQNVVLTGVCLEAKIKFFEWMAVSVCEEGTGTRNSALYLASETLSLSVMTCQLRDNFVKQELQHS